MPAKLTLKEAAANSGIPENTLRSAIREQRLPAEKFGGKRRGLIFISATDLTIFAATYLPRQHLSAEKASASVQQP